VGVTPDPLKMWLLPLLRDSVSHLRDDVNLAWSHLSALSSMRAQAPPLISSAARNR